MTPEEKKRVDIIAQALPGVVSISVSQDIDNLQKKKPGMIFPVFEKDQSKVKILAKNFTGSVVDFGGGSGFIADPSGIVVTNIHVVYEDALTYTVTLHDGTAYMARLVGTDRVHDIAYLQITSKDTLPYIPLGDSSSLMLGQTVFVIGNVLGIFPHTVTCGMISGLARSIQAQNETMREQLHGLIQTDAAINPGNSGGPLLNSDGEVIGISSANVSHAENIGFAVPINTIKNDLTDILNYGKLRRGYLGVRHVVIDQHTQQMFKLPLSEGIYVIRPAHGESAVLEGSPAQKAGILEHDIIMEIDGHALNANFTLEDYLEDVDGGHHASMRILRKGKEILTSAVLENRE